MKDQPLHSDILADQANLYVKHLAISLQFIDACFKHLPFKRNGKLEYSVTYYYQDTMYFNSVIEVLEELVRCIKYQAFNNGEIKIPAEIVFEKKIEPGDEGFSIFYHAQLNLFDTMGWVVYNWFQSTPSVSINLIHETKAVEILSLYNNIQEAIKDQIEKNEQ